MKISLLNGKNFLVVDDEIEMRNAVIFDLRRRACSIFEAGSGADAIEIVKNNRDRLIQIGAITKIDQFETAEHSFESK